MKNFKPFLHQIFKRILLEQIVRRIILIIQWSGGFFLFVVALKLKDPYLFYIRDEGLTKFLTLCALIGGVSFCQIWMDTETPFRKLERVLFFIMINLVMLTAITGEIRFQFKKYSVLHTDSGQLQNLGRHFIIGYRHTEEIIPLITKGAIGGIFMTRRNVKNRSAEAIQKEIRFLQTLRVSSGLPPLLVATDQEGGIVSHLSPPLKRLPALSSLVDQSIPSQAVIEAKVREYGKTHAEDLKNVGVNVNFSPVVDLKLQSEEFFRDFHSQIRRRAIAADASIVSHIALTYSQSLERFGVIPTVKHFPGLGRVTTDTHHFNAELGVSVRKLQRYDWRPFREVLSHSNAFMMLSHVKLLDVDPEHPVSCSRKVIQGIIREQWKHEGVLITDDFTMSPIYRSKNGIGHATVSALNAGVDLILISYDGEKYYDAMYALIQADNNQRLDNATLQKSQRRLEKVMKEVFDL